MTRVALIATGVLLAFAAPASAAATWYVDASLSGPGCTYEDPCKTINQAVAKASDGDEIDIAAGFYNESIDTGKQLTFDGVGRKVFVDPATLVQGNGSAPAFHLTNGGVIKDMAVAATNSATAYPGALAISLETPASAGPATSYTVSNVTAAGGTGNGGPGAALTTAPATRPIVVHVSDSRLTGQSGISPSNAVYLDGEHNSSDEDGVFTFKDVDVDAQGETTGVRVDGGSLTVDGGTMENAYNASLFNGGAASTLLRRAQISGKYVGAEAGGLNSHLTIRDSLVTGKDIGVRGDDGSHTDIVGSTVISAGSNPLAALWMESSSVPVVVDSVDSAFRSVTDPNSARIDVETHVQGSGQATLNASRSSYTSLFEWGGGTIPPAGSGTNVKGDPGFTDEQGGDFTLGPASPLIDRGDPAAVAAAERDFAGHKRSLDGNGDCKPVPDIGAYERAAATPVKPCGLKPDKVAPVISGVHFKPRKLRTGRTGKLRLKLSERAALAITVQRRNHGKWRGFAKLFRPVAGPGPLQLKIGPKVKGRKLRRGRYRIKLRAADAAGNRSKTRMVKFKVVGK